MSVLDIAATDYHADDIADRPSLSASIARLLVNATPAHARHAHPKLNPQAVRVDDEKFDIGTAAHALLLQGDDIIQPVYFDSWRTAEAKQTRDYARSIGKIPLLDAQANQVYEMVAAARKQLAGKDARPVPFTDGKPEQTLVWEEDGVVCRARLDWLRDDHQTVDDYKSTSASADPAKWVRTLYGMGGDIQVAFYLRGCERIFGARPEWRFVVQETSPPYLLSVVDLAPSALAIADDKVEKAIAVWRRCLETDEWPGYDTRVASLEIPTFEETRWLERDGAVA